MADIPVSFYEARKVRSGTSVSSPPTLEGETNPPVNPPGNGPSVSYLGLTDTKDSNYNGKNGYVPVVINESELELQPLAEIEDYRLVSGGVVQWTGSGYVFNVSGAFYRIGGVGYSSLPDQVTLSAPDATNDRIDVIAVGTTGSVVVITGTPSATPIKPQIDPTTQIELTSIIVTAASTDPILTEEVVYDQNTEWTGSSSGTGTASFNSAADPCNDTLSVETTNIQNGFYIEFDNGSEFDVSTVQTFGLLLKLKSNMPANQGLYLSLLDGTSTSVSKSLPLVFDKSNTTDCQFIGIDLNTLNLISYGVQYVRFTFIRTSGTPTYGGYFMDLVKFEGGINPPVTASSFISLTDTPSSYSGQASKVVSVKADESGLEFTTPSVGGVQSVTGDGVDNTDPDNPVIVLADIATSGSPYDLAQEGATNGQVLTWVSANSRYEPVTPSVGSSNWTLVGSDIYRNSKVTVGQTTIITADLGIKQNTTSAAIRVDSLDKSTRRDVIALYENSTTKRYWVDNYGIPIWKIWNGSSEAGALSYSSPSGYDIAILTADSEAFTAANRAGIGWKISETGTNIAIGLFQKNTLRLGISGDGAMAFNTTVGGSSAFSFRSVSGKTFSMNIVDATAARSNFAIAESGDISNFRRSYLGSNGSAVSTTQSHWMRQVGTDTIILNVVNAAASEGLFTVYSAGYAYAKNLRTANFTGSTSRDWKLGERKAATTALDTSQYLTVEVNGTIYNIGLVTI